MELTTKSKSRESTDRGKPEKKINRRQAHDK